MLKNKVHENKMVTKITTTTTIITQQKIFVIVKKVTKLTKTLTSSNIFRNIL